MRPGRFKLPYLIERVAAKNWRIVCYADNNHPVLRIDGFKSRDAAHNRLSTLYFLFRDQFPVEAGDYFALKGNPVTTVVKR